MASSMITCGDAQHPSQMAVVIRHLTLTLASTAAKPRVPLRRQGRPTRRSCARWRGIKEGSRYGVQMG
jgi:hypothetical protein